MPAAKLSDGVAQVGRKVVGETLEGSRQLVSSSGSNVGPLITITDGCCDGLRSQAPLFAFE